MDLCPRKAQPDSRAARPPAPLASPPVVRCMVLLVSLLTRY